MIALEKLDLWIIFGHKWSAFQRWATAAHIIEDYKYPLILFPRQSGTLASMDDGTLVGTDVPVYAYEYRIR